MIAGLSLILVGLMNLDIIKVENDIIQSILAVILSAIAAIAALLNFIWIINKSKKDK